MLKFVESIAGRHVRVILRPVVQGHPTCPRGNLTTRIHSNFTTSPTTGYLHLPWLPLSILTVWLLAYGPSLGWRRRYFAPKSSRGTWPVFWSIKNRLQEIRFCCICQTVHFVLSVSCLLKLIRQSARPLAHRRRFAPIPSVPTLFYSFCHP